MGKPDRAENYLVPLADSHETVEKMMQESTDKLDDWAIDVVDQTIIDSSKPIDVDHNEAITKGTLRSALRRFLALVLSKLSGVEKFFEDGKIQVATALTSLTRVASVGASDTVAMAPTA